MFENLGDGNGRISQISIFSKIIRNHVPGRCDADSKYVYEEKKCFEILGEGYGRISQISIFSPILPEVGKAYSFKTGIYFDSGIYVFRVQIERLQMSGTSG